MKCGISLFSSGGIGDLALRANDIHVLVANELLPERAAVFRANYPNTQMIAGDINDRLPEIVQATRQALNGRPLDVLFATPPCQGMSKNGRGKLLAETRLGRRADHDPRNQLIIPTIKIIQELNPEFVFFENVPEMQQTSILVDGNEMNILEYMTRSLPGYVGRWQVAEFADYGVPQRRQRLISIFTRNAPLSSRLRADSLFLPPATHSVDGRAGTQPWVTLRDAISTLPPLDARDTVLAQDKHLPFHRVPVLDSEKYWWVSNTPEGKSAFDNQCPHCHHTGNRTHGSKKTNGINQSNKDTPLYCEQCGERLPRPCVREGETYRIMRGYISAYKRMSWDAPASALTRNLSFACSDNKLHPDQNRVLSLHEAFILHTINLYGYRWTKADGKLSDKTIREIIGESVPPKGLEYILKYLLPANPPQMCLQNLQDFCSLCSGSDSV